MTGAPNGFGVVAAAPPPNAKPVDAAGAGAGDDAEPKLIFVVGLDWAKPLKRLAPAAGVVAGAGAAWPKPKPVAAGAGALAAGAAEPKVKPPLREEERQSVRE